jgi:signal transduction histidine kinase
MRVPRTLLRRASSEDVIESAERPSPQVVSLMQRSSESGAATRVLRDDPLGRFLLDELGVEYAYAAPIVEHDTSFGMLLLARHAPFEAGFEDGVRAFVEQSAIALAQSALFLQLGMRNDELAAANDALRERGEVIRDIVYALSHDLRTPLAAARMTMLQALDGAYGPLPDAYREIVRRTLASNDGLQALAETLLLVSRYESGEASVRREPLDIAALAVTVADDLRSLAEEKTLSVRVLGLDPDRSSGEPAETTALGDPVELRRAIGNLLANAIAATPRGGSVDVRVGRSAHHNGSAGTRDRIVLAVEDTGHGVAPADRDKLFERFAAHARGGGTGLGLYIVRRIVENLGGRVGFEPRATGGSRFFFELPPAYAAKVSS